MSEAKPWQTMTMGEQISAARDRQAGFGLNAEVRKAARAHGLNAKEEDALVQQARVAFVFVNGEARAMAGHPKEPIRNVEGGLVTVKEWVTQVRSAECGVQNEGPVLK